MRSSSGDSRVVLLFEARCRPRVRSILTTRFAIIGAPSPGLGSPRPIAKVRCVRRASPDRGLSMARTRRRCGLRERRYRRAHRLGSSRQDEANTGPAGFGSAEGSEDQAMIAFHPSACTCSIELCNVAQTLARSLEAWRRMPNMIDFQRERAGS
jgi:hypothetical protein